MCLGVPGEVMALDAADPMRPARVRFGGIEREVCLAYVPEARVGDWVIVHVGFAISRIDQAEAARTLEYLDRIGELAELEEEDGGGGS